MIKYIISDFSRVLLFPVDIKYEGKLNDLHKKNLESGDYNFWEYFKFDQSLFSYFQNISKKIPLFIFTSEYIQDYPPVRLAMSDIFREIFIAANLGVKKDDTIAYTKLADLLECNTNEVLYIDDSESNTNAAREAGMKVIHHKDASTTITEIEKIIT